MYPGAGGCLPAITTPCKLRKGSTPNSTSRDEPGTFDLIGKPNPFTIEVIREEHEFAEGSRTIMIGDRPNTDILFGNIANVDTCLVLSGVVRSVEDFETNWLPKNAEYDPTYIMDMVGTFSREVSSTD